MKRLILILILTSILGVAQAQNRTSKTPEERATAASERLNKELSLSAAQKEKVYSAALKRAKGIDEARSKNTTNRQAQQQAIKSVREEFVNEMKVILTPEQYSLWEQKRAEQKTKAKQKRNQGRSAEPVTPDEID